MLASMAPLATLCTYTVLRWDDAERIEEIKRVGDVARTLAQAVDRELRGYRDAAEMLAGSRLLSTPDLATFEDQARTIAGRAGGDFVLFDAALRKLFDTRERPDTPSSPFADSEAIARVFNTGKAEIDNLGPVADDRQLSFGVHVPVAGPDLAVRYVLTLVPPAAAILNVVQQTYRPAGWFATVVDGNGRVVARASRHDEFFGRSVSDNLIGLLTVRHHGLETVDMEGRPSVTAFSRSSLCGWHAIVWVPKALIEVPSRARRDAVLAMLGLTTLVSITAAVAAARLINRSTRRTMKAARALAVGTPVAPESSLIREDNVVRAALADAARTIAAREESLRENARRMKFVMRELSHRSKNLLTVVQSMARQTGRYTQDPADFRARFDDRISSLARSHDLLVKHDWRGATLADLIDRQLTPFVETSTDRISAEGPNLILRPDATQTIGMALHELATNASKHGALSTPGGRIRIRWDVDGEGTGRRLRLIWQESGGPPVHPPTHRGFGHVVVERMVSMALQGRAQIDWLSEGVRWVLEAPLFAITDQPAADQPGGARG
ncbi:Blue-light-activated histidine kinase [Blastochloris viridis]|uniref:histidine kinase n=1 Tax=Blastochloris viridis TaxID=1079 RepID=A0A0S4Q1H5_BLAVI|nr:Blue-light-activated histidine kinase [Blastochloris viridis]